MESLDYWKILRVLTTNSCNFNCVFCHNEGQLKLKSQGRFLDYNDFVKIALSLKVRPIKEIQFSGGEPFLNPDTIKMIEWANENTDYEIGCATNLSLVDLSMLKRLSRTKVSLNIQFPSSNSQDYNKITNSTKGECIFDKIMLIRDLGISFKLNFVWLTDNSILLSNILEYCLDNNFGLKILPFISELTLKQNLYKKIVLEHIVNKLGQPKLNTSGALRWEISNGENLFVIKYIDTPCFNKEFDKCKKYAELRLLPNLELQSCLLMNNNISINNDDLKSPDLILNKIDLSWKSFTQC
jgi:cyclic pyranopterin phosphate synthase